MITNLPSLAKFKASNPSNSQMPRTSERMGKSSSLICMPNCWAAENSCNTAFTPPRVASRTAFTPSIGRNKSMSGASTAQSLLRSV